MSDIVAMYVALVAYKGLVLLCGTFVCYLGYLLFKLEKARTSGSAESGGHSDGRESALHVRSGRLSVQLRSAAPGIFFSLFGSALIIVSLVKGLNYESSSPQQPLEAVQPIIPGTPPR